MTVAGPFKSYQSKCDYFISIVFFTSRRPDHLKPGEGGSLLVLSEKIDVVLVVISVSERSLVQIGRNVNI